MVAVSISVRHGGVLYCIGLDYLLTYTTVYMCVHWCTRNDYDRLSPIAARLRSTNLLFRCVHMILFLQNVWEVLRANEDIIVNSLLCSATYINIEYSQITHEGEGRAGPRLHTVISNDGISR